MSLLTGLIPCASSLNIVTPLMHEQLRDPSITSVVPVLPRLLYSIFGEILRKFMTLTPMVATAVSTEQSH